MAIDRSVWMLSNKRLLHYSAVGALLSDIDLKPRIDGDPKLFAVDSPGAWLWVSAEKRLIRIDATNLSASPRGITLAKNTLDLALDNRRSTLWILAEKQLLAYDPAGMPERSIDLHAFDIKDAVVTSFDPASRSIFVGYQNGLARFSETGTNPTLISTPRVVRAIGVSPFILRTILALDAPAAGALLNQATPPITLRIMPLCSGNTCGFPPTFFNGYRVSATLNDQPVGSSFVIDPSTGTARLQPTQALPQGSNTLKATLTDVYGQVSNEIVSSFTVDTVAPTFLQLDPVGAAITNRTPRRISGKLSEAATLKIGSVTVPVSSDGSFAYDLPLQSGINSVALVATDVAGNQTSTAAQITYDAVPPKFISISPADGTVVNSPATTLAGTVDEVATITLIQNGSTRSAQGLVFGFPVTLQPGINSFLISATDQAGNITQTAIRVTYVAITISTNGLPDPLAIGTTSVTITGTITGPLNTRVVVNGVNATLSGSTFSATVAVAAGANAINITATSADGVVVTKNLSVNVAVDVIDAPFIAVWSGLTSALTAGNKSVALEFVAASSRERYDRVFNDLSPSAIAEVFASLYRMRRIAVDENVAEYFVNKKEEVTNRELGFFIYFVKDGDDVWRISTM